MRKNGQWNGQRVNFMPLECKNEQRKEVSLAFVGSHLNVVGKSKKPLTKS